MLTEFLKGVKELFFPTGPSCCFCGKMLQPWELDWCERCRTQIKEQRGVECKKCARFITEGELCSYCNNYTYPFLLARSAGVYDGVLKEALYDFKYRGDLFLKGPLAKLLALEAIDNRVYLDAEIVTAVPMHPEKEAIRGYNQSELLAQEFSKLIRIPYRKDVLFKNRKTKDMASLGRREREKNIRGAFSVTNKTVVKNKSVILIDDIFTTGFTVSSCSEILLEAGAKEVLVLTIASNFDKSLL